MKFPSKETVEGVRKHYPVGSRVELTRMDDSQAPPIGTKGTVNGVDDTGSILVSWDNGSHLNVVYGEDSCRELSTVTTVCYRKFDVWDSREEAKMFFHRATMSSEGSEKERYMIIYAELVIGKAICTDEDLYKKGKCEKNAFKRQCIAQEYTRKLNEYERLDGMC